MINLYNSYALRSYPGVVHYLLLMSLSNIRNSNKFFEYFFNLYKNEGEKYNL